MAGDVIAKIKERVDIVDLISSYLKLQKSGVNYKARCPFHNEKTPSFYVSPERQIWHCFGCNSGGDSFGFVKQIEGVEFPEALRTLAARAGVELEPYSPEYRQFQSAKTKLYEICELASKFFEKQLWESGPGRKALDYLLGRGVTVESVKSFRLGFAPDSWNALSDFLQRKYNSSEIVSAGLAIKKDDGGYYDRFRSRIMFPIFDLNGQIVGFSGRVFGGDERPGAEVAWPSGPSAPDIVRAGQGVKDKFNFGTGTGNIGGGESSTLEQLRHGDAKYINTPQTPIYDKSRILYGLDRAKLGLRQKNKCLVVEGNMDVIMSHQAGVTNAVASSGTALTDGHLRIIKRYTDNLDLCFDADTAGTLATNRGVDLALAKGFNVGIVGIDDPEVKDPADYVKKYGLAWADHIQRSKPFLEFFFESARKEFDVATALGKKLFSQKLLPFVAAIANKVEQAHWVSEIALALKLREDILYQELAKAKPLPKNNQFNADIARPGADIEPAFGTPSRPDEGELRLNMLEETLLSLIVKRPELAASLGNEKEVFLSDRCQSLIGQVRDLHADDPLVDGDKVIAQLAANGEPSLEMSLNIVYLKAQELWKDFEDLEVAREFNKVVAHAKKQHTSAQLEKLEYDIKAAERGQDKTLLATLMAEFSKISKELGN